MKHCLDSPHVSTVILGASKEDQLKDNLAALQHREKFTPGLARRIETILDNGRHRRAGIDRRTTVGSSQCNA